MALLKLLTIYAFLVLTTHHFIFRFGHKYLKYFPDHVADVIQRARWWNKLCAAIVLALPISLGILILVGQNLYFEIKILIIKFRSYRLQAFVYLFEKYIWYQKKIYRKRVLFYLSAFIFGRYIVEEFVALRAGHEVAILLFGIIGKLSKEIKDESCENIDTVSDTGAPGKIS